MYLHLEKSIALSLNQRERNKLISSYSHREWSVQLNSTGILHRYPYEIIVHIQFSADAAERVPYELLIEFFVHSKLRAKMLGVGVEGFLKDDGMVTER
jgi:hypothetical protein